MTNFEAYQLYLALRLHFTTDNYDIRKTQGRVKASQKTLDKNIKLQFSLKKLKEKYNKEAFINYLVSNFIAGDKWGGVFSEDGEENYFKWQKVQDSLSYTYEQDLLLLNSEGINKLTELWNCSNGHPIIMKKYFGKICHLETLVILNKLFKFTDVIDEQLVLDPIWSSVSKLIHKYSPFVKIDKQKFNQITGRVFLHG